MFIICVPTPIRPDHTPDLSYIEQACKAVKPHIKAGNLIILESTSPPETTDKVVVPNALPDNLLPGENIFVAHCPERVLPGRILLEVVQNDRVVGGVTPACTERAKNFYETFVSGDVLGTTAVTAETTKLVENSYRDVNIAFANELSVLADKLDIDPWEVIELANRHPRVNILNPGPGVGGHCISVDPWFLVDAAPEITRLMRTAREVNDAKPHHVVSHIANLAKQFSNPAIGCLGLTYKADVDDLRESPSLEITQQLLSEGVGQVMACDPYVKAEALPDIKLHSLEEVIQKAQILVLLTDHRHFLKIPRKTIQEKVVVDTRGQWR